MTLAEWRIKKLCKKTEKYCELYGKSVVTQAICESIGLKDRIEVVSLDHILNKTKSDETEEHRNNLKSHNQSSIEEHHLREHHGHESSSEKNGKSHNIVKQANKNTVIYTIAK